MASFAEFNEAAIQEQWGNIHVLKAWRAKHRGKANRPIAGEALILPDTLQRFTLVNVRFVHIRRKRRIWNVWRSDCQLCGASYITTQDRKSNSLVRTCPTHRGQWRTPRKPRPARIIQERATPIRDAIAATLSAFALLGPSAPLGDVISAACDKLPHNPAKRDTRWQRVSRALQRMTDQGAVQLNETGESVICN